VTQTCCPGTALAALLADDTLVLDGRALEADVHVGGDQHARPLRLVGVHTPTGDGRFLTHLPPRLGPRQVADLDRVRWEVERRIRLDKSVHRLDAVDSARPCSLKTRVHAARIAATIAALLAHTPNLKTRPPQVGAPRTEAPLHPRRLALQRAASCQSIAKPSTSRELKRSGAGTRSQHASHTLAKTPTGAVGHRSWSNGGAGSASPLHAKRPRVET